MSVSLATRYLDLPLRNPFLAGASPLGYDLSTARQLEDAGAAALVLHSLFVEQLEPPAPTKAHNGHGSMPDAAERQALAFPLDPDAYLQHVQTLKQALDIPIIASLNGVTEGGWVKFARDLEEAGADALELNLFFLPRRDLEPAATVEARAANIVRSVSQFVSIPLAVKISPYFTSLAHFAQDLHDAGARGLVLFNPFFQPDIDIHRRSYAHEFPPSSPSDLLLRLHWAAILAPDSGLDLSISGGVHQAPDAIKALMAGGRTVQMVSSLLQNGPAYLARVIDETASWMEAHGYESLSQLEGLLSSAKIEDTEAESRARYLEILRRWKR